MRRRNHRPLARIMLAGSIAALWLASMTLPALASNSSSSFGPDSAQTRAAGQKLTIFKQTATPNAFGRPAVYFDCKACKGTLTLLTVAKKPKVLGSVKFTKSLSDPAGLALVKLNQRGRTLNKKPKVTVLARAKVGKRKFERKIGLRKAVSPCDLLTPAEVAFVMGEPVDPGVEDRSTSAKSLALRSCSFAAKRPDGPLPFLITLTRGYEAGRAIDSTLTIYGAPGDVTPVNGVGSKAFFVNDPGPKAQFHALKSDTYLILAGPGPLAPLRRLDLQPALAVAAFGRLK